MSTDLKTIEERQQKRYRLLKTIYDNNGDSTGEGIHFAEAFKKVGLKHDEGHEMLDYLYRKGLLSGRTGIGWLALSHEGIIEMEQSILHPEASTEHFKPGVVRRFYAAVGVVQSGADSVAHVTQSNVGATSALNADQQLVIARQERRKQVMRRIYEMADGSLNKFIHYDKLKEEEGLSEVEFWAIFDYLKAEGLVDDRYSGGVFNISQQGAEYMERQIRDPHADDETVSERSEQHFYGPVGAVQNAARSTAYVTQNNTANSAELLSLIRELRAKLQDLPDNEEALEQVADMEEEAKLANPKMSRIKAAAKYIGTMVKDVGVNVIADAISKAAGG